MFWYSALKVELPLDIQGTVKMPAVSHFYDQKDCVA